MLPVVVLLSNPLFKPCWIWTPGWNWLLMQHQLTHMKNAASPPSCVTAKLWTQYLNNLSFFSKTQRSDLRLVVWGIYSPLEGRKNSLWMRTEACYWRIRANNDSACTEDSVPTADISCVRWEIWIKRLKFLLLSYHNWLTSPIVRLTAIQLESSNEGSKVILQI